MATDKPNILLIYTGGTIGMIKNFKTGSLRAFNFNDLLKHIPELHLLDCKIATHSFDHPIDSSNMNPEYWAEIATIIKNNYAKYDGFVLLHGSDTMSYTASALSFMLENLCKPVIFTGSQLPIGDLRTDAKENLITSIQLASLQKDGMPVIKEVGLYFEYKLYRANRTTKINAEHFEAFASLNYPAIAESGVYLAVNHDALLTPAKSKELKVHLNLEDAILLVKMFPGINEKTIQHYFSLDGIKGLILETYGSGNLTTAPWFLNALKGLIAQGIPVVNVTQCPGGSVAMGHYETSTALKKMGVISGKDITTEAAIAKLMYLLGRENGTKNIKALFERPLRGEMDV